MAAIISTAKRIKRRNLDPLLHKYGIELKEFSSELDCRMISERLKEKAIRMAVSALDGFFRAAGHDIEPQGLTEAVRTFYALVPSCPVRQSTGGCGFNAGLELFVTARLLDPPVVIESGVYRGFTTWVLRQAAPQARILSFDIDFSRRRRAEPGVEYVEADLSTYDFTPVQKEGGLCFFDDHVSQASRLEQAYSLGFSNLIFDDNLPAHALHADGQTAFPTIDMILDDEFAEDEIIEWKTERLYQYRVRKAELTALRERIAFAQRFPDLAWETGYRGSNLTYVRLRRSAD